MNKFFVFCKSDGICNAIYLSLKTIFSFLFSYSRTVFLECSERFEYDNGSCKLELVELKANEYHAIKFDRLSLLPVEKWLSSGLSRCVLGYNGTDSCQSFGWIHKGSYYIHNLGNFHLDDGEFWLGPSFVNINFRGNGIQKSMILWRMQLNGKNSKYYTSVNGYNAASRKNLERCGFQTIGHTLVVRIFGKVIVSKIEGEVVKNKLR